MQKPYFYFLPDADLSETQIYQSVQTLDRYAKIYASKWEWNPKTIREIKKYNIMPFLNHAKKAGSVLIVECQTGRDYQLFTEAGYHCLGVSVSYGLLEEAVKRIPTGLFMRHDYRCLPFMPESFDAIYADACTLIPHKDIHNVLNDFRIFLRQGGIVYLSVKLDEHNVMVTEDLGDKRFVTLFQKDEIKGHLDNVGLDLIWSQESTHTDPAQPHWFSLLARKSQKV